MVLFKLCRGLESELPEIYTDGYVYFCTDTGNLYIDWLDNSGVVQRTQVNAGADGVVPSISVSKDGKIATIVVKDANGEKIITLTDGTDGISTDSFYGNTPFRLYNPPLNSTGTTYYVDGSTKEWNDYSPILPCPKYLGIRLDGGSRIILYIGTLDSDGNFNRDEAYDIYTPSTSTSAINYLNSSYNGFIETDGEHVFRYRISNDEGVMLVGCDEWPETDVDCIASVPNYINDDDVPKIDGLNESSCYYSLVLPADCYYAILFDDSVAKESRNKFKVSYQTVDESTGDVITVLAPASFGNIPPISGTALLRVPNDVTLDSFVVYINKSVKSNAMSGRRRLGKKIGEEIIGFNYISQNPIQWNDSTRPMIAGRRFYGVPYSSRWINSHYVGYEITPETLANALKNPYSIAYDGGICVTADSSTSSKITDTLEISGRSEISKDGGPGYGLVCSAFACLMMGNPYPQSNRGFTFDDNFSVSLTTDINSGKAMINSGLSHVVMVDEVYDSGYSLYEATDPCVTKTIHTSKIESTYADSKTRLSTLDNYIYTVANKDINGYDSNMLNFDYPAPPEGDVRPWRGHKSVYGPWDKKTYANSGECGTGVGVTIHNNATSIVLYVPDGIDPETNKEKWITKTITVDAGTKYLDLSAVFEAGNVFTDYITADGTYKVRASGSTVEEKFRYFSHNDVILHFDEHGIASFIDAMTGESAKDVLYVYAKVTGYGGEFSGNESTGAIVIASGKRYPDLAKNLDRIVELRAAIVADPATDPANECWGKYSCVCSGKTAAPQASTAVSDSAKSMLLAILSDATYNSNQSTNIADLAVALGLT